MWVFLSRRIRLWLLVAVGLPFLRRILGGLGERLEASRGETTLTRGLKASDRHLARYGRRGRRRR